MAKTIRLDVLAKGMKSAAKAIDDFSVRVKAMLHDNPELERQLYLDRRREESAAARAFLSGEHQPRESEG